MPANCELLKRRKQRQWEAENGPFNIIYMASTTAAATASRRLIIHEIVDCAIKPPNPPHPLSGQIWTIKNQFLSKNFRSRGYERSVAQQKDNTNWPSFKIKLCRIINIGNNNVTFQKRAYLGGL